MKNSRFRFVRDLAVCAVLSALLTSSPARGDGARCGQVGQRVCGAQDCEVFVGWADDYFPFQTCPPPCVEGLESSGGMCRAPAGGCDIDCKMARIARKLGAPSGLSPGENFYCYGGSWDPYSGRKASRSDLGVAATDKSVTIDIGGEGLYIDDEGRQFGTDQAINLNCSLYRTTYGDTLRAISHLVFGFADHLPFTEQFADTIIINNAPIVVSEIERVIRPGGHIKITYVTESESLVETMISHMCLNPAVSTSGTYNTVQLDVPGDFNYLMPRNCPRRDREL